MLIITGGIDCSGKSTICSKLSKLLDCEVNHFDKPKNLIDGKNQYFSFLKSINNNENTICDRFHDGEHVYAPIYRGYESNYLHEIEIELKKMPYLFIHTTASIETIIERINKRGEDFIKEEHYQLIMDLYYKFLEKQSMPYVTINTDDSNVSKYIETILTAIDIVTKLHKYSVKNNCQNIYYGNIFAKYFVVADYEKHTEVEIKEKLLERNIYHDSWITTNEDKIFLGYQFKIFNPKNVIILS